MRNLRLGVRTLFRAPIVTIVALMSLMSLALGIGANVAIYSLFNEMMLAPLPVPRPDQLVLFGSNDPSPGSHSCGSAGNCRMVFSYRMFRDLEAQPGPFSGVATHQAWDVNIAVRGNTLAAEAEVVSGSYFAVLGIKPTLGRLIGLDDDKVVDGNPVAVLGHAYWETQLGSDPAVVGQHIMVNGHQFTIIGVAPVGFEGTTVGIRPDAYIPLTMRAAVGGNRRAFDDRTQYWAYLFARLKPGVTMQQAGAQENALYHSIINTAYSVVQRRKEIGVRMALGASSSSILGLVLRQVAMMTAVGAVLGSTGAYAVGRGAASLLQGARVQPGRDGRRGDSACPCRNSGWRRARGASGTGGLGAGAPL